MELTDTFGRKINYLRLSVTDRCNMRCVYCMPVEGVPMLAHGDVLSYEDLLLVAQAAVAAGIEKIRVTGGEPLVRKDIIPFLTRLAALPGLRQLVLTTNGLLLDELSDSLHEAGVQRLNISLDSLRPETFAGITRGADVRRVLAGIEAAERSGFPLKINMVVMRGINDQEIEDFAALTIERSWTVRFIEYMPAVRAEDWEKLIVPGEEVLDRLQRRFGLTPLERDSAAGPARIFRADGAVGTIGVITPVSGHFCGECNRIRVTSGGRARSCLFSEAGVDLKPFLMAGDQAGLSAALRTVVACKPGKHDLAAAEQEHAPFAMSSIGG